MLDSLTVHPDTQFIDEIIIVDNGNAMESDEINNIQDITGTIRTKVVANNDASYASGVNTGAKEAAGDLLIISNNDIEWQPEWSIQRLIKSVQKNNDIGAAGPQMMNKDQSWQSSSGKFPSIKSAIHSILFINSIRKQIAAYREKSNNQHRKFVDYIDGAFLVTPRKIFCRLGGWDEQFEFYGEDADYCFRVQRAGKSVALEPQSKIIHIGGATSSTQEPEQYSKQLAESTTRFVRIHSGRFRSQLYAILMAIANIERYLLYMIVGVLNRSDDTTQRRKQAIARFHGYIKQI